MSWFKPSQQLSTMQPLPHSPAPLPVGWGGESGKKVELVGSDKNGLITKVKYNLTIIIMKHNNNSNEKEYNKKKKGGGGKKH